MFQEHITVAAFSMGFVLSLGLMFAVGPQHLKLVKAGMSGSHVGTVATTGYLSEIIIVVLGLVLAGTAIADTRSSPSSCGSPASTSFCSAPSGC